jgi:hypothetical protein
MLSRRSLNTLLMAYAALPSVARAQVVLESFRREGVTFSLPRDWSIEDAEDKKALYCLSPQIEGGVDASMLIELPKLAKTRSVEAELQSCSSDFASKFPAYRQRRLLTKTTSSRLSYGLLEYSATKKLIPVIEQYILVPASRSRRVFVFTSTTERTAETYLPLFEQFMASLRVPQ